MAQLPWVYVWVSLNEGETWNTTSYDFDWHRERKREGEREHWHIKNSRNHPFDASLPIYANGQGAKEKEREMGGKEREKQEVLAIVLLKKEPIQGSITATVEYVLFPMVVSSLFQLTLHSPLYTYTLTDAVESSNIHHPTNSGDESENGNERRTK